MIIGLMTKVTSHALECVMDWFFDVTSQIDVPVKNRKANCPFYLII